MSQTEQTVAIIGAGVIGLTVALELSEKAHKCTIISEQFPDDETITHHYASPWAGAHHVSFADPFSDDARWVGETFSTFWEMAQDPNVPIKEMEEVEFFFGVQSPPECLKRYPFYRELTQQEYPLGATAGAAFKTVSIDAPRYLRYLMHKCKESGVQMRREKVDHIQGITSTHHKVVVAAGNGAATLGGVADKDMYTAKGVTLIASSPTTKRAMVVSHHGKPEPVTYIIPRLNEENEVVLGGTRTEGDITNDVSDALVESIRQQCVTLAPELDDVQIKSVNVGLRPARRGGVCVEMLNKDVVNIGGLGGVGFQTSVGVCRDAVMKLLSDN